MFVFLCWGWQTETWDENVPKQTSTGFTQVFFFSFQSSVFFFACFVLLCHWNSLHLRLNYPICFMTRHSPHSFRHRPEKMSVEMKVGCLLCFPQWKLSALIFMIVFFFSKLCAQRMQCRIEWFLMPFTVLLYNYWGGH